MINRVKKFDFYRHVPIDLTEPTAPGAIISISCGVIMFLLFIGEVRSLFSPPLRTDMYVASDGNGEGRVKVHFNISFHKLPCFITSLDVVDALGRHEMGTPGDMGLYRLSPQGASLGRFQPAPDRAQLNPEYLSMREEGCQVHGYIEVSKVPGNFHVSSHGLQQLVMNYSPNGNINVQHTIHYLWMGEVEFHNPGHGYEGELHPLNGLAQRHDDLTHYEYNLDIVPTLYEDRGKSEKSYQISASMHKQAMPMGQMPAAVFRYQLFPVTVRFHRDRTGFLHFLTYVCAIVGGVFTVAGLLNRVVHKTVVQVQRRLLGKDG